MNRIPAVITSITCNGELFFVEALSGDTPFGILLFQLNPQFSSGSPVWLLFKESEVSVACGAWGESSFSNVFPARVSAIKPSTILAQVCLESGAGEVCSIFTTRALERMALEVGTKVTVMIKASQIGLEAHHDD
jgi:molybdate transport system regulatory protein